MSSEEERRTVRQVLEQYYRYIDGEIGRPSIDSGPSDLLLVVSAVRHGAAVAGQAPAGARARQPRLSGTHERAPDGFLHGLRRAVRAGTARRAARCVDVTPTVLYSSACP